MRSSLVFTRSAIESFRQSAPPDVWMDTLAPDLVNPNLVVLQRGETTFVATKQQEAQEPLLVIGTPTPAIFPGRPHADRRIALDRCLRWATISFEGRQNLPPSWRPFNAANVLSFFATSSKGGERLVAVRKAKGTDHMYVAELSSREAIYELSSYQPDYSAFDEAIDAWQHIRVTATTSAGEPGGPIDLTQAVEPVRSALRYEDWLQRLTAEQRDFVERTVTGPIKLRGQAGTGKTLALIVKCLHEAYRARSKRETARLLFVTHSWGVAEEADRALREMDSQGLYQEVRASVEIHVTPLLSLVSDELEYSSMGLQTLGTDSKTGKDESLKLIAEAVSSFRASDWAAFRAAASPDFQARMEAAPDTPAARALAWDLMNEFACVLGAQRIGMGGDAPRRDQYLKGGKRGNGLMPLKAEADRRSVLALYTRFLDRLRAQGLLSSDQLVNDFLGRKLSFYWDRMRKDRGYDIVFVDEMHLFNDQERLVFHQLTRRELADGPPVIMAMDPKQSPRETFVQSAQTGAKGLTTLYSDANLGKPQDIELTQVFRYTPEILAVIRRLDNGFPTLDLGADWGTLQGISRKASGSKPLIYLLPDAGAQVERAFSLAQSLAGRKELRRGKVALLTMDPERFDGYQRQVAAGKDFIVVSSREDVDEVRYAGRRFVLSQPEYVAGLQFAAVVLVDVNRDLLNADADDGYQLRRFCSELYLGISRAEEELHIFASEDAGGFAPMVDRWLADGLVISAPSTSP